MRFRRTIAAVLAVINVITTTSAFALEGEQAGGLQQHSVTIRAEVLKGQLIPLNNSPTGMNDHGSILTNANGSASVEIQGTYRRNQTLASAFYGRDKFFVCSNYVQAVLPAAGGDSRALGIA